MNDDRLGQLHLLPPPTASVWQASKQRPARQVLRRPEGTESTMELPLFWYAPDWYQLPVDDAGVLAAAVGRIGVTVAALRSEITSPDVASPLHDDGLPRMVPYRPERYGFDVSDFDDALAIDLRLTLAREPSGRFAFPPTQVARWESDSGDAAVAGGGWVEAASFPPDVQDLTHLGSKIAQLRQLSPKAVVMVSINPIDLETELPDVLDADPDGIILRLDRFQVSGLRLAILVRKARAIMTRRHSGGLPLWVVPGEINADDAAKLLALGASAVALDAWCRDLRHESLRPQATAATRLGISAATISEDDGYAANIAAHHLGEKIERLVGLISSTSDGELPDRLGSFDPSWSEALGIRLLG